MGCPTCRCPLQTKPSWLGGGSAERLQHWYLLPVDVCHKGLKFCHYIFLRARFLLDWIFKYFDPPWDLFLSFSAIWDASCTSWRWSSWKTGKRHNFPYSHSPRSLPLCGREKFKKWREKEICWWDKYCTYDIHKNKTSGIQDWYHLSFHPLAEARKTKKWNPIESSLKSHGQSCSVLFSALHLYLCFGEVAARSFHCLEVTCQLTWKMCSSQMVSNRNHLRHSYSLCKLYLTYIICLTMLWNLPWNIISVSVQIS